MRSQKTSPEESFELGPKVNQNQLCIYWGEDSSKQKVLMDRLAMSEEQEGCEKQHDTE